ncbi:MAG: YceI family protein [Bacteroidota bacterium]
MKYTLKSLSKVLLFSFFLFHFTITFSQSNNFKITSDTEVNIEGSSTLHSWKAVVSNVEGELMAGNKFAKKKLKEGEEVGIVSLKFGVETIDGGRGDTMNDKIKKALKSSESPYIEFKSTKPAIVKTIINKADNTFNIVSKGELTMAGISKPVEIELEGKYIDASTIQFTGKRDMKMSDFDIEQPSAMFGTIVAGDDITINFNLLFSNTTNKM